MIAHYLRHKYKVKQGRQQSGSSGYSSLLLLHFLHVHHCLLGQRRSRRSLLFLYHVTFPTFFYLLLLHLLLFRFLRSLHIEIPLSSHRQDGHLLVDIIEYIVLGCLFGLEVAKGDELGPQIGFEGSLEEERDVIKEEAEDKEAELVLDERGIVDVVGPQVGLGLLQQLLRLQLMTDQLPLPPVHLRLQTAQPTVQVVLPERVRDLVVVLQRVLEVHLGRRVLLLAEELDVAHRGLAAGRAQPAPQVGEFDTCSLEEELGVCVLALREVDAALYAQQVGHDEFLLALEADHQSVVQVGLNRTVLHLPHHEEDGHEVDDYDVHGLLLQLVAVRLLRRPSLLVGLYYRQQLSVAQWFFAFALLLLVAASPEQVLIELSERVLIANEAHLPQEYGFVVVLIEEEEFLGSLRELGKGAHVAIDLLEPLHEFLADALMELDLLFVGDFVFDVDDDGGVDEVVAAVGLLDALHQGVVHEFADGLLPLAVVLEHLGHHLDVQPVRQQTQHLDHFRSRLVLVVDHVQRDLHGRLHHPVHALPVLLLRPLVELLAHVRLQQHHVQLRQTAVRQQRGGQADGLRVAVQKLEEGVLARLLQVLLQRVEIVQLLLLDLPGHLLEEQLLGLRIGESAQLEQHFRAVVDLPADGVPRSEQEVQVGTAPHQYLHQPLETLPLLRLHNTVAVVQHQQH